MSDSCFDLVRQLDKDRFLATLFAPQESQKHLFALYAFNAEICRIRDVVSEPQIGEIRLQWWLDSLDGIYENVAQSHPVAAALKEAVGACHLPKQPLINLAHAHQFDFYADAMQDRNALEGYLGETQSVLFQLAAMIVVPEHTGLTAEAAGYAGVAYGLAELLAKGERNQKFIPQTDSAGSLRDHAIHRLGQARAELVKLVPSVLPAFLPLALTESYLKATPPRPVPQWKKQWHLWRAARREKI
jgi:15-cis-phytoene synthase